MSVTAVPLRPIKKGSLVKLWLGIGLLVAIGVGFAWTTARAVSPSDAAMLSANAKRPGVITTSSGLQYEILKAGTGPKPTAADMVLVDYEGMLLNGEVFDASAQHGGPATMPVGGVIPGFTEALQLMSQGAKYRFWIPSELAYGSAGAGGGVIPPDAPLVFVIDLHAIAPAPPAGAMGPGGMPGGMPPGGGR